MTTPYPKRLIEVDLPIRRISAHARREKSIRHGHISTLHIWWARRPLAACRAVICAALWPDPADELCPQPFRDAVAHLLPAFAEQVRRSSKLAELCTPESFQRWMRTTEGSWRADHPGSWFDMRAALLDFIADFANWDASTAPAYLETARGLTQAAHEALGGEPGSRPLVVDPFAGGGAIPLEALRVGADAFASDLNPVAVLLNKVVLEYIPKYGNAELRMMNAEGEEVVFHGLAEAVRYWGQWIKEQAERELAEFYPKDPDGATPIAYLWARTIRCEGPGCGIELPLIGQVWLSSKEKSSYGLGVKRNEADKSLDVIILHNPKPADVMRPISGKSSATCPMCGYTTPAASVRSQLAARSGGSDSSRLIAVVTNYPQKAGKHYRIPTAADMAVFRSVRKRLELFDSDDSWELSSIPDEDCPPTGALGFRFQNYGITRWRDLYTSRQLVALATLAKLVRGDLVKHLRSEVGESQEQAGVIQACLALAVGRVNDLSATLCRWLPSLEAIAATNGGQNKMPMILDFVEANPIGNAGGNWSGQIDWIVRVIRHLAASDLRFGTIDRTAAQEPSLPEDIASALITDPPYYDAFGYSDLSEFFYIWLRRAVRADLIGYAQPHVPKKLEIVSIGKRLNDGRGEKTETTYQVEMARALRAHRSIVQTNGIGVIVFANKTTRGWEAILQAIIDAGWTATASWPVATERPNRQRAIESAALQSSVHLVCRPLDNELIGDWREVLQELPSRIHAWLPRLAREGIVGADAIFACLGPALEIFSRYSRVEKASGEVMTLAAYLEHVWAAVSKEALDMVFHGADTSGFEEDARLTAMWLWTLGASGNGNGAQKSNFSEKLDFSSATPAKVVASAGYSLEFDAARKIAQGLGAHLEQLGHLVELKGSNARLLPAVERTRYLFGVESTKQPARRGKREAQPSLFEIMGKEEAEAAGWAMDDDLAIAPGRTVLDRVHQSMLLFAAGRSNALKRYLVEEGIGKDERFWSLAQALSALYPSHSDEKRWVDGVLARKKGLGF